MLLSTRAANREKSALHCCPKKPIPLPAFAGKDRDKLFRVAAGVHDSGLPIAWSPSALFHTNSKGVVCRSPRLAAVVEDFKEDRYDVQTQLPRGKRAVGGEVASDALIVAALARKWIVAGVECAAAADEWNRGSIAQASVDVHSQRPIVELVEENPDRPTVVREAIKSSFPNRQPCYDGGAAGNWSCRCLAVVSPERLRDARCRAATIRRAVDLVFCNLTQSVVVAVRVGRRRWCRSRCRCRCCGWCRRR